MKEKNEEYRNLGYQNSSRFDTSLIDICHSFKHITTKTKLSRFEYEICCDICKYKYQYDSSD